MALFEVKPGVALAARMRTHEQAPGEPTRRPLRVYAVDPSVRKTEGCVATIGVPYEPLKPGPVGSLFEVECADGSRQFSLLNLEDPRILISNGLTPAVTNPAFHQQMVYAVASSVYGTFRSALGRTVAWACDENGSGIAGPLRLKLRPHVESEGANATYDKTRREIRFGYSHDLRTGDGLEFACLSHDIIVHEMTHALIDGLRSHFMIPTNRDVLGFHEGLSDIISVFHHFLFPDVLVPQIRRVGPQVENSAMLTQIAANFGLSTIGPEAVRGAGTSGEHLRYSPKLEAHEMGRVLATAIFAAFAQVFRRKTERYLRLAGPQAPGFWREELIQILAEAASELARSFLHICIRAIDYCPPLDLRLGEYLRALITADANLVPDDPWGYRDALIESFADHGIHPAGVLDLTEDALLWRGPNRALPPIEDLSFSSMRFNGDPAVPASAEELDRQARALGAYITVPDICDEFGLMPYSAADGVELPAIESIRMARRVGPDGQVLFDLVAEVTQCRVMTDTTTGIKSKVFGGSTIVLGPRGEFRFVISKNIRNQARIKEQMVYQSESDMWESAAGRYRLRGEVLPLVHRKLDRLRKPPVLGGAVCA